MKALHLCFDHNFIENSKTIFDYYYPNQNIFLEHSSNPTLKIIRHQEQFIVMNLKDKKSFEIVEKLCIENSIDRLVLHGMGVASLSLIRYLCNRKKYLIYWLFWGYELYQTLAYEKSYQLIDDHHSIFNKSYYLMPNPISKLLRKLKNRYLPSAVEKTLPYIDYFCFWNRADYELLTKYYNVSMKYKFFAYGASKEGELPANLFPIQERKVKTIMINHQASLFGNHVSMFNRIAKLDTENNLIKLVPLSYGSNPIRNRTLYYGNKIFGKSFHPVMEYLKTDEYFKMLKNVDVAVFGQRRQEASGNIIQLLRNGVKVFLRNDNSLLEYYRKQGYIIFSVENDLTRETLFTPLSLDEQVHNRQTYLDNRFYYSDFMPEFFTT